MGGVSRNKHELPLLFFNEQKPRAISRFKNMCGKSICHKDGPEKEDA